MRQTALALFSCLAPKDAPAASQDADIGSQTTQHKLRPIMAILVQTCWVFPYVFSGFCTGICMELCCKIYKCVPCAPGINFRAKGLVSLPTTVTFEDSCVLRYQAVSICEVTDISTDGSDSATSITIYQSTKCNIVEDSGIITPPSELQFLLLEFCL